MAVEKKSPTVPFSPQSAPAPSPVRRKIVALISFADALTGRDYRRGEEILDWDIDRVREYSNRGIVMETSEPAFETK